MIALKQLEIFFQRVILVNTFYALRQPDGQAPGIALAEKFIDFVSSGQGQRIIRDYGKQEYDEGIYNDASYGNNMNNENYGNIKF